MFKFNFSSQDSERADAQPSSLNKRFEATAEEVLASEAEYVGLHEPVKVGGSITLLKAQLSTAQAARLLGDAELEGSDLLPGQYEGGFKVWEGSLDLAEYVSQIWGMAPQADQPLQEDGGGGGSEGGLIALLGGAEVHFQDYNREVLQSVTIPNVAANWGAWKLRGSCPMGSPLPPAPHPGRTGTGESGGEGGGAAASPSGRQHSEEALRLRRVAAASLQKVVAHLTQGGASACSEAEALGESALQATMYQSLTETVQHLEAWVEGRNAFHADVEAARTAAEGAGSSQADRAAAAARARRLEEEGAPRITAAIAELHGRVARLLEVQLQVSDGREQAEGARKEQAQLVAAATAALDKLEALEQLGQGGSNGEAAAAAAAGGQQGGCAGGAELAPPAAYFSGDWGSLGEVLEGRGLGEGYDVILTAETIYSLDSMRSLYCCIKQCLKRQEGVAYLAAKSYYFGVGGGTAAFLKLVQEEGEMEGEVVRVIDDGVSNKREILRLRFC